MKVTREGSFIRIELEGPLGETSPLFLLPLQDAKSIDLDMTHFTSINSVGVKNWIIWTLKIPALCTVKLINCPLMVASQASMVMGFINSKISIESVRIPYACENCGIETMRLMTRGKEYEYAGGGLPSRLNLPMEFNCTKCGTGKSVPDIIVAKTFKFLG